MNNKPYEYTGEFFGNVLAKNPDIEDDEVFFEKLCNEGLNKRFGASITSEHTERLSYEIEVIKKFKAIRYMLLIWDIVKELKSNGYEVGPGRGGAAGSLVNYVLEITDVDPLKFGLLFTRFLNAERDVRPDIDIDCSDGGRDHIITYLRKKYGDDHVAEVSTYRLISQLSKEYTSGIHASSIIIADKPVCEYIEVKDVKGKLVTVYDRYDLEKSGIDPIDILELGTLTRKMIYNNVCAVGTKYDDPRIYKMISSGNVKDSLLFNLESMRDFAKRFMPESLTDIATMFSMNRPGPDIWIEDIILSKEWKDEISYFWPDTESILESTYGSIVYQEQIIMLLSKYSGCSLEHADVVRRNVSKKAFDETKIGKEEFLYGCKEDSGRTVFPGAIARGYDKQIAEKLFDEICDAAPYSFLKAHAIPYAMMAIESIDMSNEIQSFDNFIEVDCNSQALKYAKELASLYDEDGADMLGWPLVIYGGSCTGKTHLLKAVENYVVSKHPQKNVLYTTGLEIMREMELDDSYDALDEFIDKYSNLDLLIVDDLHQLYVDDIYFAIFTKICHKLFERGIPILFSLDRPLECLHFSTEFIALIKDWPMVEI